MPASKITTDWWFHPKLVRLPVKREQIIDLVKDGIDPRQQFVWADLGAGAGDSTLALCDLLGFEGVIFAVDTSLSVLKKRVREQYVKAQIHLYEKNFTQDLSFLPQLDGILMANSLHYVRTPEVLLESLRQRMRPGAAFILVEYDREEANQWVPYPISFVTWQRVALAAGFTLPEELARIPSIYGHWIYSSVCYSAAPDAKVH